MPCSRKLVFLFFLVGFLLPNSARLTSADDCSYLLAFARASSFAPWLSSINSSCCSWQGVFCSSASPSVTKIALQGKQLHGSFYSLLRPTNLLHLDLSNNSLSGSLPSLLPPQLQWLDLSKNNLSGTMVASSMPRSLLHLNLSSNRLYGSVPPLPGSLRVLDLSDNYFSGPFPSCSLSLVVLNVSSNKLSGSLSLVNCSQLQALEADDNLLKGPMPSNLDQLGSIRVLRLSFNRLRGWLPPRIGTMSSLRELWLDRNLLRGPLPREIANCTNLVIFSARENRFSGSLTTIDFPKLSSLEYLDLSYNALAGTVPASIASCNRLVTLALTGNSLQGEIPPELGNLTSLATLSLSKNSLTGAVPDSLARCPSLVAIVLSKNYFQGSLMPHLNDVSSSVFPSLQLLAVGNANLTGPVPAWLRSCRRLQALDLSWNRLTGTIPAWIGDFKHLFYLDLSNNTLEGGVPVQLGGLAALQAPNDTTAAADNLRPVSSILFVKHRNNMTRLQYNQVSALPPSILLGSNHLGGSIPSNLSFLRRLLCLDLASNGLSGEIPQSLGDMVALETLDLSLNQLTGTIPSSLLRLFALSKLNLSSNQLHGNIPSGAQFSTFSASSFAGNLGLCGFPLSTKCSSSNSTSLEPETSSHRHRGSRSLVISIVVGLSVGMATVSAALWAWTLLSGRRAVHHRDDDDEYEDISTTVTSCGKTKLKQNRRRRRGVELEQLELQRPIEVFHNRDLLRREPRLTNADLVKATNGFDQANIVGCGGFGLVFCGSLSDGTKIAIKKLTGDDCLVEREFDAEVETLAMADHPNLVALQGFSTYAGSRLLLYPYMENGSLDSWLHDNCRGDQRLGWPERLAIARNAAAGIHYLHSVCEPHIVHRDIKSSNILLDGRFVAHVADFGFARLMCPAATHVSTEVVGTFGYIPPEYCAGAASTPRGDVYSYGVVLVELLSGRRPVDTCQRYDLVAAAQDPRGAAAFPFDETMASRGSDLREMEAVLRIAARCVDPSPVKRPTMEDVVRWLESVGSNRKPNNLISQ